VPVLNQRPYYNQPNQNYHTPAIVGGGVFIVAHAFNDFSYSSEAFAILIELTNAA
jgi:hypothetical protein